MFDVDEMKSGALRDPGGANIIPDDALDVIIGHHHGIVIRRNMELVIENRMVVGDAGL